MAILAGAKLVIGALKSRCFACRRAGSAGKDGTMELDERERVGWVGSAYTAVEPADRAGYAGHIPAMYQTHCCVAKKAVLGHERCTSSAVPVSAGQPDPVGTRFYTW